ncbi:MAG TPA: asparagine synthetase B, partial [Methylomirabilota bacterium]|nr:asparagine synthetase B [Methylomirabilota bacterium]
MSGFAGFVNLDGAPIDRAVLTKMMEAIAFRGPDARNTWSGEAACLGHTLLQTTDESADEHQPLSFDGKVWIVADARIDARQELVADLRARGRDVDINVPDVELILGAWCIWQENCVEHLLGDFSFAIWDDGRRRLFCARDQMGVKPFYYAHVGSWVGFSNTLECVLWHPKVSCRLNDLSIADFLLFNANQEPATTAFADIQRLPAAHTAVWSDNSLKLRRYWTLPIDEPVFYRRQQDYVARFQELLRAAVSDRLRTGRVGIFMSGGL